MQQSRADLLKAGAGSSQVQESSPEIESSESTLNPSQISRLRFQRLDQYLQQMSSHPAWAKGLQVWDHLSALKPSLVKTVSQQDIEQSFQTYFRYDPEIEANPSEMTTFKRPCVGVAGCLCQCDPNHAEVCKLVTQFDTGLVQSKLGGEPVLICLDSDPDTDMSLSRNWVVLGCMSRKPIAHYVVHLYEVGNNTLPVAVEKGEPKLSAMHQVLKTLVCSHAALRSDEPGNSFGLRVSLFAELICLYDNGLRIDLPDEDSKPTFFFNIGREWEAVVSKRPTKTGGSGRLGFGLDEFLCNKTGKKKSSTKRKAPITEGKAMTVTQRPEYLGGFDSSSEEASDRAWNGDDTARGNVTGEAEEWASGDMDNVHDIVFFGCLIIYIYIYFFSIFVISLVYFRLSDQPPKSLCPGRALALLSVLLCLTILAPLSSTVVRRRSLQLPCMRSGSN